MISWWWARFCFVVNSWISSDDRVANSWTPCGNVWNLLNFLRSKGSCPLIFFSSSTELVRVFRLTIAFSELLMLSQWKSFRLSLIRFPFCFEGSTKEQTWKRPTRKVPSKSSKKAKPKAGIAESSPSFSHKTGQLVATGNGKQSQREQDRETNTGTVIHRISHVLCYIRNWKEETFAIQLMCDKNHGSM